MDDLGLPPRQLQILRLLGAGLTNQQIADYLGISINTVKTLLKVLYARINAANDRHAVAIAYRAGILPVGTPETRRGETVTVASGRCPVCGDGGGFHDSQVHLEERFRIARERAGGLVEADEPAGRPGGAGWVDVDRKR